MAKKKKKKREILFAHQAYWFLYGHPAMRLRYRAPVDEPESQFWKDHGDMVKCENGVYYAEHRHSHTHAIEKNLDIFYARVDETGTINDDETKNRYTEVWLEFGPIIYESDQKREINQHRLEEAKEYGWEAREDAILPEDYTKVTSQHDWKLDCGAPTFDEALVKLANKVLKEYGDYQDDEDEEKACGGPEKCADCAYTSNICRHLGIEIIQDL